MPLTPEIVERTLTDWILFSLSRISGAAAARCLDFDKCQSLESLAKTAIVRQCQQVRMEFGVDNSFKCEPQPRAGDFGIATDGFIAILYSPCYWKSAMVNLNGEGYEAGTDGRGGGESDAEHSCTTSRVDSPIWGSNRHVGSLPNGSHGKRPLPNFQLVVTTFRYDGRTWHRGFRSLSGVLLRRLDRSWNIL